MSCIFLGQLLDAVESTDSEIASHKALLSVGTMPCLAVSLKAAIQLRSSEYLFSPSGTRVVEHPRAEWIYGRTYNLPPLLATSKDTLFRRLGDCA